MDFLKSTASLIVDIERGAPIAEIDQTLVPQGFGGDRRALWDTLSKVSEVVNAMGDASAVAQGLTKPITTADRLRNSYQKVYLLIDQNAKEGKGVVTGMLKTGVKSLYVFDRDGQYYQVSSPCVLDFYVHESRQRTGLGKQLFQHMLERENVTPSKLAVDRPSDKLLSFLGKHYGLNDGLQQSNNYVVFDGFFPEVEREPPKNTTTESLSASPAKSKEAANGLQQNFSVSPYGRYGAPRPTCSMGQIIHNQSAVQSNEGSGLSLNMRPTAAHSAASIARSQQEIRNTQAPVESAVNVQPQSVRSNKSIPPAQSVKGATQIPNETVNQNSISQPETTSSTARLQTANETNHQATNRSGTATPAQQAARSQIQIQDEQVPQNEVPPASPISNQAEPVVQAHQVTEALERQYSSDSTKTLQEVCQSPKLLRPRSLSLQRSEESEVDHTILNNIESEVQAAKSEIELAEVENDIQDIVITENIPLPDIAHPVEQVHSDDDNESTRSKSPNSLTAQGFFDLKFYHSRLW